MGSVRLTPNERYTFARNNNNTVILSGTDNAQAQTVFNHSIMVSASAAGSSNGDGSLQTVSEAGINIFKQMSPGSNSPALRLAVEHTGSGHHCYLHFKHESQDIAMGILEGNLANNNREGFFVISDSSNPHSNANHIMMMDRSKNVYIPNGGLVLGGNNDGSETAPGNGELIIKRTGASYKFTSNSTSGYTTTFNMDDNALFIGHGSSVRDIRFQTDSSNRMTIKSNGKIGINTTSPEKSLHILNSGLAITGTSSGGDTLNYRLYIDSAGSTGHGLIQARSDDGDALKVLANGQVEMPNLGTFSSSGKNVKWFSNVLKRAESTRKIKKNIKDLDSTFVDNFSKLRPAQWICRITGLPGFGFIAEEIAQVNKSYATVGPDYTRDEKGEKIRIGKGEYKKDSEKLVPDGLDETAILTAAVAKIQQLEKRIEELENI